MWPESTDLETSMVDSPEHSLRESHNDLTFGCSPTTRALDASCLSSTEQENEYSEKGSSTP